MEKRPKAQKIIRFPNRKERRKILLEHEDPRIRAAATLRITCGWLLISGLALFLIANYNLFTPSSIRNIVKYAVSGFKEYEGNISTIQYANEAFSDADLFGGSLAYADSDSLYLSKPGNPPSAQYPLGYSSPVVETSSEYVLAYDRGGTKALLVNSSKKLCGLTLESPILNGSLSDDGHFVLVTAEQGYRTAAALYDSKAREVLRYDSSEYYIVSAGLTPSGNTLAALGFRQDGVSLVSRVLFLSAADGKDITRVDIPDSLAMELCPLSDDAVAVLCDNGLYLITLKGKTEHILEFSSGDLLAFSDSGEALGFAVRSYNGSARSELYAMRSNKKLKGPYGFDGDPSAVAVSDSGMAVLSAAGVCVYDLSFAPLWQNPDAVGAKRILLAKDYSVMALYAKHAIKFSSRSSNSEQLSLPEAEASDEPDVNGDTNGGSGNAGGS